MVDFIAKYTCKSGGESKAQEEEPRGEEVGQATWVVYVDGSSTSHAAKEGAVLVTPKGNEFEYAIKFGFKATNNEAEYEAMFARLHLAHALRAKRVRVNNDSQLMVR